jgi:translation initiation factor 5
MFYDADILQEKVLLEWAGKVSKMFVNGAATTEIYTKAEPFIKWLKEAEEEDDTDSAEEEDAEDDLEVRYVKSVHCEHWAEQRVVTFQKFNTGILQHSF